MKKAFIFLTTTFVVSFVFVSCLRYATEYSENNSNKQAAEYTGIVDNRTVYLENDSNRQNSPQVSTNIVGDVVARFTPLSANERFAYSIQNQHAWSESNRLPMMHWQKMTAYAVRDNNIEDVTKLFLWEPVRLHFIQFTSDFKKCFLLGTFL